MASNPYARKNGEVSRLFWSDLVFPRSISKLFVPIRLVLCESPFQNLDAVLVSGFGQPVPLLVVIGRINNFNTFI